MKHSRILLQRIKHFWYKLDEISFFHYIWSKFGWVFANLHIYKTWIFLQRIETFVVNNIFCLIQATQLCFKIDLKGKMRFSLYYHLKMTLKQNNVFSIVGVVNSASLCMAVVLHKLLAFNIISSTHICYKPYTFFLTLLMQSSSELSNLMKSMYSPRIERRNLRL